MYLLVFVCLFFFFFSLLLFPVSRDDINTAIYRRTETDNTIVAVIVISDIGAKFKKKIIILIDKQTIPGEMTMVEFCRNFNVAGHFDPAGHNWISFLFFFCYLEDILISFKEKKKTFFNRHKMSPYSNLISNGYTGGRRKKKKKTL